MDLFERFELTGQTRSLTNLVSKPEFRQNYLTPIRKLAKEDQCFMLQKVIDGTYSLAELKTKAAEMKKLMLLKKAFVQCTSSRTWENAVQKFPFYASDDQLKRFIRVDLQKEIPQSFMDFCRRAKGEEGVAGSHNSVSCDKAVGVAIDTKVSELNAQKIKQVFPCFYGAKLSIITCAEVSTIFKRLFICCTLKRISS